MSKMSAYDVPDYSDRSFWSFMSTEGEKPVDTVFIYPTCVMESKYGDIAGIEEMLEAAEVVKAEMASAYTESTNVYLPYYRQIAFTKAEKFNMDGIAYAEYLKDAPTYEDVTAALDYYFEHYNNGKPFIIAAHSQGSCATYVVLENYMKEHPEYLMRMVAAYPIGWARDQDYYARNSHLKFAEGETEAGVVVSWNTFGPGATGKSIVLPKNAVAINPLNWLRDDTYAGSEENKGSLVEGKIVMNYADAKLNTELGYVECNAEMEYAPLIKVVGEVSLHCGDYPLYYNNIKENVRKRIDTFMASRREGK